MKCNKCGHEWESNAENLLRGRGCPSCARKSGGEKHRLSHSKFIDMLPETIEVLEEYTKYGVPIKCRCKVCGYEWVNKPEYLLKNKYCPQCAGLVRYTNETFK